MCPHGVFIQVRRGHGRAPGLGPIGCVERHREDNYPPNHSRFSMRQGVVAVEAPTLCLLLALAAAIVQQSSARYWILFSFVLAAPEIQTFGVSGASDASAHGCAHVA